MGDHYVPRFYLAEFASEPDHLIWVYDKANKKKYRTNIVNVAQEGKLYSAALEKHFANKIEGPIAPIVRRLTKMERLSGSERLLLSMYLLLQWKRTIKGRERFHSLIPQVADETKKELIEGLSQLAEQSPAFSDKVEVRKIEVTELIENYKDNPPLSIWHDSLTVQTHSQAAKVLMEMRWRYFIAPKEHQFVTSDNPVFFFEHLGLRNRDAELTFPISDRIALWASWNDNYQDTYLSARPATVRELNRRTAINARRFLYAKADAYWIMQIHTKNFHHLNRLR